MKKIWKVLGVAALAVGFTPYRVEKNEETGEKKVQALLWQMTRKPMEEEKEEVSICPQGERGPPVQRRFERGVCRQWGAGDRGRDGRERRRGACGSRGRSCGACQRGKCGKGGACRRG